MVQRREGAEHTIKKGRTPKRPPSKVLSRSLELQADARIEAAADRIVGAGFGFGTGAVARKAADDRRRRLVEDVDHADVEFILVGGREADLTVQVEDRLDPEIPIRVLIRGETREGGGQVGLTD